MLYSLGKFVNQQHRPFLLSDQSQKMKTHLSEMSLLERKILI